MAASTVYEILRAAGVNPAPRRDGPAWRQFLHAQAAGIPAAGFLHVDTVAQRGVRAGFQGVGDEPAGGIGGEVAAAGQAGVVAGAPGGGGTELAGVAGALLKPGCDGERGFGGQRG